MLKRIQINHELFEPEIKLFHGSLCKQTIPLKIGSSIKDSVSMIVGQIDDKFESMKIQRLTNSIIDNLGSDKINIIEKD